MNLELLIFTTYTYVRVSDFSLTQEFELFFNGQIFFSHFPRRYICILISGYTLYWS